MGRKRDLLCLLALPALWSGWPHTQGNWVDPLPPGEHVECNGKCNSGMNWTLSRDSDCSGTYRTLKIRTDQTDVTARVLNGQILIDPASNPPRFLVIQPVLWFNNGRYPHGKPGRWCIENTPLGYRWK